MLALFGSIYCLSASLLGPPAGPAIASFIGTHASTMIGWGVLSTALGCRCICLLCLKLLLIAILMASLVILHATFIGLFKGLPLCLILTIMKCFFELLLLAFLLYL